MYQITYSLFTGTHQHRSTSVKLVLEALKILEASGARVEGIVVTETGNVISRAELQIMADRQSS